MAQTQKFQGVQTSINRTSDSIEGWYRGTCVATLYDDGTVKLYAGKWRTATTKARMNQFANEFCNGRFSVFQKGGEWFVSVNGETIPFSDGMTV